MLTMEPTMIHPTIAVNDSSKGSKIPICSQLNHDGECYDTTPKPEGSLKDLCEELKDVIKVKNQKLRGQIIFALDKDIDNYICKSLDELVGECGFASFNPFANVVICCPLHYLESNSYNNKESELIKLIFRIDKEDLSKYPELEDFYYDYMDDKKREKIKIHIYDSIKSAATLWFDYVMIIANVDEGSQIQKRKKQARTYDVPA